MTYQIEDIAPRLQAKNQEAKVTAFEHLRHQMGVGVVMSELQADPRWAIYGNHLQAIKEQYDRQSKGFDRTLSSLQFLTPEKYGQLKVSQAETNGVLKGITLALDLAKNLIDNGNQAATLLSGEKKD